MSITNYGELKTAVANWMARSDLTSRIPEFISLAEGQMYHGDRDRDIPPLRIRAMHTTSDLTPSGGTATVPSGLLEAERLYVDETPPRQLEYLPPEDFWVWDAASEIGTPTHYTIEGSTFRFQPANTSTIKLAYYAALTAMSDDSDTNWVLTNAPHVYLHGALAQAYDYVMDDARAERHFGRFASALHSLNREDEVARMSGAVLAMRPRAFA